MRRGRTFLITMRVMDSKLPICISATLLALTACGPPDFEGPTGTVVRDSAGVRIVENAAPAWEPGEGWSLSEEPLLEIGVIEGEAPYMFSGIRGVRRLPDESLVVLDGGSAEIRIFDADGRHVRSMGRQGEGPGEFQFPRIMATIGDSLVIWDGGRDAGRSTPSEATS